MRKTIILIVVILLIISIVSTGLLVFLQPDQATAPIPTTIETGTASVQP